GTLNSLTDVNVPNPASGTVLTYNGQNQWVAAQPTGGSGNGGGDIPNVPRWDYHPDAKPAIPDPFDDEFDDPLNTDSKWVWINQGSGTAYTDKSHLFLQAPAQGGANIKILAQPIGSEPPWTITAKITPISRFSNINSWYLVLVESS